MNEPDAIIVFPVLSCVDPENENLPRMTAAEWDRVLDDICEVIETTRQSNHGEREPVTVRVSVDGVHKKTGIPIYTPIDGDILTFVECRFLFHGLRPESELSDLERNNLELLRQAHADNVAEVAVADPAESVPVELFQEVSNE